MTVYVAFTPSTTGTPSHSGHVNAEALQPESTGRIEKVGSAAEAVVAALVVLN
jgi:hypothetical protein